MSGFVVCLLIRKNEADSPVCQQWPVVQVWLGPVFVELQAKAGFIGLFTKIKEAPKTKQTKKLSQEECVTKTDVSQVIRSLFFYRKSWRTTVPTRQAESELQIETGFQLDATTARRCRWHYALLERGTFV